MSIGSDLDDQLGHLRANLNLLTVWADTIDERLHALENPAPPPPPPPAEPTIRIATWPAPSNPADLDTLIDAGFNYAIDWCATGGAPNLAKFDLLTHALPGAFTCGQFVEFIDDPNGPDCWFLADDIGYYAKRGPGIVDYPPTRVSNGTHPADRGVDEIAALQQSRDSRPGLLGVPHFLGYGARSLSDAETTAARYWSVNRGPKANEAGDADWAAYASTPGVGRMTTRAYGVTSWNDPTFRDYGPTPKGPDIKGSAAGMFGNTLTPWACARARRLVGPDAELWAEIGCNVWGNTDPVKNPNGYGRSQPTYDELCLAMRGALANGVNHIILWGAVVGEFPGNTDLVDNPAQLEIVRAAIADTNTEATS